MPSRAEALWPFSFSVDAAERSSVLVHDSSIGLLAAAVNVDPNPNKSLGHLAFSEGVALVAGSGPSGTLADVKGAVTSDQISLYVVRTGDTLSDISEMFGVSVNTIVWANDLRNARSIRPGQQLVILPVSGVEHTVVKGDTLASIAKKYNADALEIADFNGLEAGTALAVESTIIVPGGELSVPASVGASIANTYRGGSGAELSGYFSNPVPGSVFTQNIHGWNGIDLGAPRGTPVHAAAPGVVVVARNNGAWNGGYGNYVVITHPNGVQTLYSHLTTSIVSIGQFVERGQIIGSVGSTGKATGAHLHFEVRGARNPFYFCPVGRVCEPR